MNKKKWICVVLLNILISVFARSAIGADVEILGSAKFKNQVSRALTLLKKEAPEAFAIVIKYVGRIEQGKRSGMWAYKNPPTFEVADRTAFYSITWCASTIAHDAFHSKLYHDYKEKHSRRVPDDVWVGVEAEKKCLKHQLVVLKKIKAPKHEVTHLLKFDGTHNDINKDGRYDSEDYKKRDW